MTHLPAWQPFSQGLEEEVEDEDVVEEAPACATRCSSRKSPAHLLHAAEAPVQARARIPSLTRVCVCVCGNLVLRYPASRSATIRLR